MERSNLSKLTRMASGSLLCIGEGAVALIRVRAGDVWVTENGGGEDHVLSAGQSLRLRRKGGAIAQALSQSVVTVVAPEPVSFPRRLLDAMLAPLFPPADAN